MTSDLGTPLTDAEIDELDTLLSAFPEDRCPFDVAMLDGFLAGVLLAPEPVLPSTWLPVVFAAGGGEIVWPDAATAQRTLALAMRRHNELAAHIAAREPFEPIVFDLTDADGVPATGSKAIAALSFFASGFAHALDAIPSLAAAYDVDDEFAAALDGVLRHVPVDPDDTRPEAVQLQLERQQLERDVPLADLDEAIDELVASVLDAADISRPRRPAVRAAPKVGRNAPCPCGSGRKYKACHGRDGG